MAICIEYKTRETEHAWSMKALVRDRAVAFKCQNEMQVEVVQLFLEP